jgi:hypothetical protein
MRPLARPPAEFCAIRLPPRPNRAEGRGWIVAGRLHPAVPYDHLRVPSDDDGRSLAVT